AGHQAVRRKARAVGRQRAHLSPPVLVLRRAKRRAPALSAAFTPSRARPTPSFATSRPLPARPVVELTMELAAPAVWPTAPATAAIAMNAALAVPPPALLRAACGSLVCLPLSFRVFSACAAAAGPATPVFPALESATARRPWRVRPPGRVA